MDNDIRAGEAAAGLVQRLSGTHSVHFFGSNANLNKMSEWIGAYMNQADEEVLWYGGLCKSFRLAMDKEKGFSRLPLPEEHMAGEWDCYRPVWGVRTNDAMVRLGLMLLDQARGRMKSREIYHCMEMTLGQYLDALADIRFREDGTRDLSRAECFRTYRDMLLRDYDGSKPLGEALADILGRYIGAWREFDRLDHVLYCMEELSAHLEGKKAEKRPELQEYYFKLACQGPENVPDPCGEEIAPGALYDRFLFPGRDYHPDSLKELTARSPSLKLQKLLDELIRGERVASAMRELNVAVTDLYILFAEPYLWMGEYHYEEDFNS